MYQAQRFSQKVRIHVQQVYIVKVVNMHVLVQIIVVQSRENNRKHYVS
jgi:hypothetical protein